MGPIANSIGLLSVFDVSQIELSEKSRNVSCAKSTLNNAVCVGAPSQLQM